MQGSIMPYRCDTGALGAVQRTPIGGYRVPATIAKSCVLSYPWGREYVPQSTLEASAGQLAGLPVSLGHPPERRIDSGNYSARNVGHVGQAAEPDKLGLHVDLYVQRADAVEAIESGSHRQCSAGYDCELDRTPGVSPDGERYDAVQTARTYNHIALVKHARGGPGLSIRLDDNGDMIIDEEPASAGEEIEAMKKTVRIDGVDHEVEAPAAFFQALDQDRQKSGTALAEATSRADTAEGERDALRKDLDEAKTRLDEAMDPTRLDERVKARTELESKARAILGDEADFSGKTDRQVMELTIRTDEKEDFSGETDDYIRGMFIGRTRDAKSRPRRNDSLDKARMAIVDSRFGIGTSKNYARNDGLSVVEAARQRRLQDDASAYTRPLAVTRGGTR